MATRGPVTRAQILDEARAWLGTPFHHQGRVKGVGVDCVGLLAGVARALGLTVVDRTDYGRGPDGHSLAAALDAQMRQLAPTQAGPGDVLLLRIRRWPQHVGILGEGGTLIHAHAGAGRVVETPLAGWWGQRVLAAYRFPGLED